MRKLYKSRILTCALVLLATLRTFAQIPNAGFENWTSGNCVFNSYNDPNGWGDINSLACIIGAITCIKTTTPANVHSGSAALELLTQNAAGQTAPGICATGSINQNTQAVQGGFPLTTRPDKLIGWYKYAPVSPDTFSVSINIYNGATSGTIIGTGSISGANTVSTYTKFIVPITYTSSATPDSAQITLINSAGANGQVGTLMYVDDLSLVSCAGFNAVPTVVGPTCSTATGSITLGVPVNGTAPYTYGWSNSATGNSISNLSPGTYRVTITDDNGCQAKDSIVVSATNVPFTVTATGSTTSCSSNTGTVSVVASAGNAPYTYLWANNSTSSQITNLGAGNYRVTVTDAHGCTTTATGAVTTPNGPTATDQASDATCFGSPTGSVTVTVNGGTAPISYAWSNSATTASLTGVTAGTYTLTITDNNSCSFQVSATVGQPTALTLLGSSSNLSCNGDNTGTAGATVSGGTSPYTYAWTNSAADTSFISNLGAGAYTVLVTDNNGCKDSVTLTVTQPAPVTVTVATTNASSATAGNGTAWAVASGGTGSITYAWDNTSSHDTITHLTPATYCVTVTDANSCTAAACDSVGFSVGINTISSALVKIYPNPANSQVTIETNSSNGQFMFTIFALDGRLVEQRIITGEKNTILLNHFAEGFYTYQLNDMLKGGINYGKLEIQR